jgi:NAD(P)-dependent dehydrogenase (short-subunit alcohol dehydrogenase family)
MPKTAVITGTTHGIGLVTTRELARAGWSIVMLCRDVDAARQLRERTLAEAPGGTIDIVALELASLASVRAAADQVRQRVERIDCLLNNAGRVCMQHERSADGYELTFAVNQLGPFLLTQLLLDRMAPAGRIVNVASRAHIRATLDLGSVVELRGRYRATAAYAQSKLANVLWTFALARRLAPASHVTANCLHPGVVATNLLPPWLRLVKPLISNVIDVERGARTSLFLAQDESVAAISGMYFDEDQKPQPASALAREVALQEALWCASAAWVERFS